MQSKDTSFRWHHWSVTAPKEKLLELVAELDASLPAGWKKMTPEEVDELSGKLLLGATTWAVYRYDQTSGRSGVNLVVELRNSSELRGGKMQGTFPSAAAERTATEFAGGEVDRFLDQGIRAAAAKVGLAVRKATVADIYFEGLPWEVQESLVAFSDSSRKTLPLNRLELAAWQAYVIAAYRGPDDVSYEPLAEWLVAHGWSPQHAAELGDRFFDQLQLLIRYRETLVVA